jgi:chemotaxis signal transduction protein
MATLTADRRRPKRYGPDEAVVTRVQCVPWCPCVKASPQPITAPASALLKFTVGGLNCALPLADVQEITAMVSVTPLPGASPRLLGVIDYHGTPCPVVDVRHLLNLPAAPIRPQQHLVVLRLGAELLAIPCDQAETVLRGHVRPVAAGRVSGPLIHGVIQGEEGVIMVLESAHLMKGSPIAESTVRRLTHVGRDGNVRNEL